MVVDYIDGHIRYDFLRVYRVFDRGHHSKNFKRFETMIWFIVMVISWILFPAIWGSIEDMDLSNNTKRVWEIILGIGEAAASVTCIYFML
jgi:hypothetical protein